MDGNWFYELAKYVIVVVALLLAYVEFKLGWKHSKRWIKFGIGFMGVYWAAYYIYQIVRPYFDLSLPAHQVFVRAGILVTLSLILSSGCITYKDLKGLRK